MESNKIVTAELVPGSKLVDLYEGMGYAFAEFKTRFKDEAMAKADELRGEGFEAAYVVLKKGWYGCFIREASAKVVVEAAAKADKPVVPVEIDGVKFASTKEARAFARRVLDACRAAEDEAGL